MGVAFPPAGSFSRKSSSPVSTSKARKRPSIDAPIRMTPPAVMIGPPRLGRPGSIQAGSENGLAHHAVWRAFLRCIISQEALVVALGLEVRAWDQPNFEGQVRDVGHDQASFRIDRDSAPVAPSGKSRVGECSLQARGSEQALVSQRGDSIATLATVVGREAEGVLGAQGVRDETSHRGRSDREGSNVRRRRFRHRRPSQRLRRREEEKAHPCRPRLS